MTDYYTNNSALYIGLQARTSGVLHVPGWMNVSDRNRRLAREKGIRIVKR